MQCWRSHPPRLGVGTTEGGVGTITAAVGSIDNMAGVAVGSIAPTAGPIGAVVGSTGNMAGVGLTTGVGTIEAVVGSIGNYSLRFTSKKPLWECAQGGFFHHFGRSSASQPVPHR